MADLTEAKADVLEAMAALDAARMALSAGDVGGAVVKLEVATGIANHVRWSLVKNNSEPAKT